MHNWLDHFKMEFHQLHASGHMSRHEPESLATSTNPGIVFPIHTEDQDLFRKECRNVQTIEPGKEYKLQ